MALHDDRNRLGTLFFYVVLALLAYLLFRIFQPFLAPLAWAGVLVVVCYPWHARLERRWGPTRAAAFSTLAVTLVLIVPALLLLGAFVREGIEAARGLEAARSQGQRPAIEQLQGAWERLQQNVPLLREVDAGALTSQALERVSGFLATRIGPVLKNAAVFLFDLFLMLFATFYFFRDAGEIVAAMRRLLPFEEEHRDQLISQSRDLIFASVTSSLIVAAVQGLLGGLSFAIVGLGAPVFWGVVMGFFSLLPLVGAWIIWVPAAIWLFVSGDWKNAVLLTVLGAGVVGMVDNFLRPMLLSGRSRLNGLLIFISVLGGIAVFGMLGVVMGPIVVATAASVIEVYFHDRSVRTVVDESGETVTHGKAAVLE